MGGGVGRGAGGRSRRMGMCPGSRVRTRFEDVHVYAPRMWVAGADMGTGLLRPACFRASAPSREPSFLCALKRPGACAHTSLVRVASAPACPRACWTRADACSHDCVRACVCPRVRPCVRARPLSRARPPPPCLHAWPKRRHGFGTWACACIDFGRLRVRACESAGGPSGLCALGLPRVRSVWRAMCTEQRAERPSMRPSQSHARACLWALACMPA